MNEKRPSDTLVQKGCVVPVDSAGHPYSCKDREGVFTVREQRVLRKIRELKEEVRKVKTRLKELSSEESTDAEEKAFLERRLQELGLQRRELEKERKDAAEERMRLLGHV